MNEPRLAWFTPLPPERSGIAAYSAEVLPRLAGDCAIDVYVERPAGSPPTAPCQRVLDAHDFLWAHARAPYDLVVYQMGNETCHDYIWPYLARVPGLVVLHDGMLHHARARCLLRRGRLDDFRAELRYGHPDASCGIAELGALGLLGTFQYFWPMLRVPVTAARVVAVHNAWLAADIRHAFPDARIEVIRMGVDDPLAALGGAGGAAVAASAVRASHRVPADAVVFAAFGRVTPEKRLEPAIRALASLASRGTAVRLLLVGEPAPHYDVMADAAACGIADLVTVTGHVSDADLPSYLAAADVCVCLRWPTGRETSASWLRAVAAGKPTIVTDLAHTVDTAALDPRTWTVLPGVEPGATDAPVETEAVSVAIDLLDEHHSLELAVDRLARDEALRAQLGAAARARFERHHTLECMVEDYRRAIGIARADESASRAARARLSLPPHLLDDGTATARAMLDAVGVRVDFLDP